MIWFKRGEYIKICQLKNIPICCKTFLGFEVCIEETNTVRSLIDSEVLD